IAVARTGGATLEAMRTERSRRGRWQTVPLLSLALLAASAAACDGGAKSCDDPLAAIDRMDGGVDALPIIAHATEIRHTSTHGWLPWDEMTYVSGEDALGPFRLSYTYATYHGEPGARSFVLNDRACCAGAPIRFETAFGFTDMVLRDAGRGV